MLEQRAVGGVALGHRDRVPQRRADDRLRLGVLDPPAVGPQRFDGRRERRAHGALDRQVPEIHACRHPRRFTAGSRATPRLPGSLGSGPAMISSSRRALATVSAIGPTTESVSHPRKPGVTGTRPNVGLWPTTPQKEAGMRIEPPPSLPRAIGTAPEATAAPEPPLEPPATRVRSRGCGDAVQLVLGHAAKAQLGVGRAAHDVRARPAEPTHHHRVLGRDEVRERREPRVARSPFIQMMSMPRPGSRRRPAAAP